MHVLLSLHLKLNGDDFELKTHKKKKTVNISMAYSQDIQMVFCHFHCIISPVSHEFDTIKYSYYQGYEITVEKPLRFGVDF